MRALWRLVPVDGLRRAFRSWFVQLYYWYVVKPALFTTLIYLLWPGEPMHWYGLGLTYLALAFALNSRLGRAASERVEDSFVHFGQLVRSGLLPGLIRLVVQAFAQVVDSIEYVLFVVDEWLRFRGGDSKMSLVVRTIAGLLWAPVAFLTRFYMVVLIEPGYNPLKAPASYLAAKVLAPMTIWLMSVWTPAVVANWPLPLRLIGYAFFYVTFFHLCDVFGFLFWEMGENWALYRSNRGQLIRPAGIGAHNETMRGLLAPGFHSGTVPRLYGKLRAAEQAATKTLNWNPARTHRQALEEVDEAVERFVAREMVALLVEHPAWGDRPVEVGPAHLSTNRVAIELINQNHPAEPVAIEVAYQAGWVVGSLRSAGWLDTLPPRQRRIFAVCLAYLYRRLDVDLVHEQLLATLRLPESSIELTDEGAVVWTSDGRRVALRLSGEEADDPEREEEMRQRGLSGEIRFAG